jgi:hypothetical protein
LLGESACHTKLRADAHRCGVKVWPLETARNLGVTSANGFRNARRKSTRNTCPGKVILMRLKILLGKFVTFFAGQIPVEGHKNIIDSFQKLIVSPKRFICAHSDIQSQSAVSRKACGNARLIVGPLKAQTSPLPEIARVLVRFDHVARFIVNANHSVSWKRE